MPRVWQWPSVSFTIAIGVVAAHETLFFEVFVELLDIEVNDISELVTGDDAALFFVSAIWVHLHDDFWDFRPVRFDFSLDVRFIVHLFFTELSADGIDLSDTGDDFLQLNINLSELLLALLLAKLVSHLFFKFFLGSFPLFL